MKLNYFHKLTDSGSATESPTNPGGTEAPTDPGTEPPTEGPVGEYQLLPQFYSFTFESVIANLGYRSLHKEIKKERKKKL